MYTPAQVSEMLDIAPSSLRRYVTLYGDLLSETAKLPSKSRRYTDADILILRRLKELIRARKTDDEIRQLLQVVETDQPPSSSLALLPDVLAEFQRISDQLSQMQNQQQATRKELDETRAELEELRQWVKTPWYKRIRKRPPE
jgi:DNA-binding transcriptional MerR regulator